jgi:GT2 family glycosyltransferase
MYRTSRSNDALPPIYILTLNWNRRDDTLAFIESALGLGYEPKQILVVDNASSDGSVETIGSRFPEVRQIVNQANLGFAAGMNVGLRSALQDGAEYVFLVNNDTLLTPDLLDRLVDTAETHQAQIVAPAIYYADTPDRIWWLGGKLRPLLLEVRRYEAPPHPGPFAVDFVTGCAMLISRHCLEQVGLFDERFFMYYEDADYCLRVRRSGGTILVEPDAVMYHKVASSSGGSASPGERYLTARGSVLYFRKYARGRRIPAVIAYRSGSAVRTLIRLLRHGRFKAAGSYVRGLWDGLHASIP